MRATRSQMSKETKNIIAKAKRDIDNGRDYREVLKEVEESIQDNLQRNKAIKSVVDYID